MKSVLLILLAGMLTLTSVQAKSPGANFSYNCQIGNPEIFQTINQREMEVGESGKIEIKLTRPIANWYREILAKLINQKSLNSSRYFFFP